MFGSLDGFSMELLGRKFLAGDRHVCRQISGFRGFSSKALQLGSGFYPKIPEDADISISVLFSFCHEPFDIRGDGSSESSSVWRVIVIWGLEEFPASSLRHT